VAYEDLHTGRLGDTVRKMAQFYSRRCRSTVDEDRLVATIRQKIEACRGKTPPHMIPGIWRQMFSDEQKKEFEQVAGVLNRRLGYEENLRPIEKHRECEPVGAKVIPMHKRNNVPRVGGSHTPQAKMRRRGR